MLVRLNANLVTLLTEIGAILLALIALGWLRTQALTFSPFGPADVLNRLTPLILTAGFIERSVEVLISPWRDPEANKHATAIAAANTLSDFNAMPSSRPRKQAWSTGGATKF